MITNTILVVVEAATEPNYILNRFNCFMDGHIPPTSSAKDGIDAIIKDTGLQQISNKFVYKLFTSNGNWLSVYLVSAAIVYVVALHGPNFISITADQLHKMVRDNDIVDTNTLAAIAAVLLQSPKANEYINNPAGSNQEAN